MMINLLGKYELVKTCDSHPEQYDVVLEAQQVGYLRVRHGVFRADVPNVGGKIVFVSQIRGDGEFDADERDIHLTAAIASIDVYLEKLKEEE